MLAYELWSAGEAIICSKIPFDGEFAVIVVEHLEVFDDGDAIPHIGVINEELHHVHNILLWQ